MGQEPFGAEIPGRYPNDPFTLRLQAIRLRQRADELDERAARIEKSGMEADLKAKVTSTLLGRKAIVKAKGI